MKKQTCFNTSMIFMVLMLLVVSLSGCLNRSTPTPEATLPPTPEATATATAVPDRLVLFDPNGTSGEAVAAMLGEFAATNTLGFETWTSLAGSFEGVKVIILYGNIDNLTEVAATAPQTQFVAVTQAVTPAANLSSLVTNPVHLAFMAGYLAAMTSEEWRAGALLPDDSALGLADAFMNGGQYLCGRCTPINGAILYYPQVYTLPAQSDAAAWSAQAAALSTEAYVNSIYIDPAADFPEVLDKYASAVIYGSNPASPNLARYAAVLGADATSALQQALPDLLAGNGGKTINSRIGILIINNAELVTPAKQAAFDLVARDLADDLIIPLSVP